MKLVVVGCQKRKQRNIYTYTDIHNACIIYEAKTAATAQLEAAAATITTTTVQIELWNYAKYTFIV